MEKTYNWAAIAEWIVIMVCGNVYVCGGAETNQKHRKLKHYKQRQFIRICISENYMR